MSKLIEIVFAPDGQTRIETKGFEGHECREAAKFIKNALGKVTSEQLTSEFYQTNEQQQSAQEGM